MCQEGYLSCEEACYTAGQIWRGNALKPEIILENGMLLAQEEATEAMQGRYPWLYEMAQAQLLQEDLSAQKERMQNYLYTGFCAKRLFGMLE